MLCYKNLLKIVILYFLILSVFICIAGVGSRVVTVFSENKAIPDRKIVIIDAGHGGVDGGATSISGVLESKINLEIALKLQKMCHLLGIKTVMIRTKDISVYTYGNSIAEKKVSDLKERVRIVNSYNNCVLVSIHQNYFSDGQYSGAQVFYGSKGEGKSLAAFMQNELVEHLNPGSNRKSKEANGVYLMNNINCTGVLIECGFISNSIEEQKLLTTQYQQHLCVVITSALSKYLNT